MRLPQLLFSAILALAITGFSTAAALAHGSDHHGHGSFLDSLAASPSLSANVVPANGEGNPYGVAVVPRGFPSGGTISAGDILVSNFNGPAGKQGTGTTIVDVKPSGATSTFFSAPASLTPVGLTTALVALRSGIVVVGNTPTTDGTPSTISNGSLIFLDSSGNVLLNLKDSSLLQGPWDMTADDSTNHPVLFVSTVLNGGVTEIDISIDRSSGHALPVVRRMARIASGFTHRTDPAALVVGPTGLLLARDEHGGARRHEDDNHVSLYVASTGDNSIVRISGIERRHGRVRVETIASGAPLQGPLGLAWAPNGNIVASNGDATGPPETAATMNLVVEVNPNRGSFVDARQLDNSGTPGAIFGIAIAPVNGESSLIYVNDNTNTVNVLPRA